MAIDPNLSRSFAATVDWLHAGLIQAAATHPTPNCERGLGGKFFYAGDLDGVGSALVVAANIAGAATLTASADTATQKQAIRDGVIDFLVTSLDEALRILKNELRKGETVAVCVSKAPEEIECEMVERGVLPDLLPPGALDAERYEPFLDEGARQIDPATAKKGETVLTWSVTDAPARWLPRLDALANECLGCSKDPEVWAALRWLRLSPRYLGRFAQGMRLLRCQTSAAQCFVERVREQMESCEIDVPVDIRLSSCGDTRVHRLVPRPACPVSEGLTLVDRQQSRSGPKVP
jgi:hypothetical protein